MTFIDESLYKKFFDWNKGFSGKVSTESFDIKFLKDRNSPIFTGKFITDLNKEESLILTINLGVANIIVSLLIMIACPIYFYYSNEYKVMGLCFGAGILIQLVNYYNLKDSKKQFFQYLENFDRNCKITNIQKNQ